MRNPFRRRRKAIVPSRPSESWGETLTRADIEAIRDWSRRGVPTAPHLVLDLIATIDHGVNR